MTASLGSGTATAAQNTRFNVDCTVTDLDQWQNPSNNDIFQARGGSISFEYDFNSGDAATVTKTQYADDLNAGWWKFTISHVSLELPTGMTSNTYVDTYKIIDNASLSSFLKDPNVTLEQQVTVNAS